jgi:hypothetical protein
LVFVGRAVARVTRHAGRAEHDIIHCPCANVGAWAGRSGESRCIQPELRRGPIQPSTGTLRRGSAGVCVSSHLLKLGNLVLVKSCKDVRVGTCRPLLLCPSCSLWTHTDRHNRIHPTPRGECWCHGWKEGLVKFPSKVLCRSDVEGWIRSAGERVGWSTDPSRACVTYGCVLSRQRVGVETAERGGRGRSAHHGWSVRLCSDVGI